VGRFSVISVSDARRAARTEPAPASSSRGRTWRDRFVLRRRVTTTDETDEPVAEPATAAKS
jgi:hypothetical protein